MIRLPLRLWALQKHPVLVMGSPQPRIRLPPEQSQATMHSKYVYVSKPPPPDIACLYFNRRLLDCKGTTVTKCPILTKPPSFSQRSVQTCLCGTQQRFKTHFPLCRKTHTWQSVGVSVLFTKGALILRHGAGAISLFSLSSIVPFCFR